MLDIPRIRREFEKRGHDASDLTDEQVGTCANETLVGHAIQIQMAWQDLVLKLCAESKAIYRVLTGKEWTG